jgi:hypothetical protein
MEILEERVPERVVFVSASGHRVEGLSLELGFSSGASVMIGSTRRVAVYAYTAPTDLRRYAARPVMRSRRPIAIGGGNALEPVASSW